MSLWKVTIFAVWLLFLGSHLLLGGRRWVELLAEHDPVTSSPTATSGWWLNQARVGAATPEVATLLGKVPGRQAVMLLEPKSSPSVPASPFMSYLAWPRRLWIFHCNGATVHPHVWPKNPQRVPWILYFDLKPPKALRRRLGTAGRLTLVAADPNVPWTSYCSP